MCKDVLFLEPVFQERIWGGTALKETFSYNIPSENTGECWAISAHKNGETVIKNTKYAGMNISQLWEKERHLFGNISGERFPLLTKILDANDDLSVQVHPDDEYARRNENGELGKTECWYIIDCEEDAEMIMGHHALSQKQFVQYVEEGQWNELLQRIKIKPGDFFYVPSGTIHALCKGTLVLETQQSSDTTYRVYDYDRVDNEGNTRELHLAKALDVTTIPHEEVIVDTKVEKQQNATITTFVEEEYFSVYKWDVKGKAVLSQDKAFQLASVLDGEAQLVVDDKSYVIKKGDHFILPAHLEEFIVDGKVSVMVSHP